MHVPINPIYQALKYNENEAWKQESEIEENYFS